jgi:hypothetical protein
MLILVALTCMSSLATAQNSHVDCSNAQFSAEVLHKFPKVREACLDVMSRDDKYFAVFKAKLLGVGPSGVRIRPKLPNGTFAEARLVKVDPNRRVLVDGRKATFDELALGQELMVYIEVLEPMVVFPPADPQQAWVPAPLEEVAPVRTSAVMPHTASYLPWVGLVAAVLICMGLPSSLGLVCIALLFACLVSCASGPTIHSNADPAADFSRYKTFAFMDEVESKQRYDSFAATYIKAAVTREMQARGFQHNDNPELVVNFHVQSKEKLDVNQTPYAGGYYGYRGGAYGWGSGVYTSTYVDSYTEGTLNVDIVDRSQRKLLWEGIAVGRITDRVKNNLQGTVDKVVQQIFQRFPKQPPAAGQPVSAQPTPAPAQPQPQ